MNKAWMVIATLLVGCGGKTTEGGPPPTSTLTCAPDSDAIKMYSSGDALSLIRGSWKVCSPGDSGTRLDGIQIDSDGSWRGLKTVGSDLVVDYTQGGPQAAINTEGLPDKTVIIDLWRYGGGKYQVTAQVFKGPRMDLNFQGTGYAGGLFVGGDGVRPVLPPAGKCAPYIKPLAITAASQINFRLTGTKWARCFGVGPFPDQSSFDGIEFTDTQFFALKDNGAGSLQRDAVAFPPQNWTMQDNTADDGPGGWVLAVSPPAGGPSILRMVYFDESPTPRLYIQRDATDYESIYQRIQ